MNEQITSPKTTMESKEQQNTDGKQEGQQEKKLSKFKIKELPAIFKSTFKAWNAQDPFRQSAVIAYYAVFSLPALLVVIIAVAGFIFGREAVTGQLSAQISKVMGADTAKQIEEMIANA